MQTLATQVSSHKLISGTRGLGAMVGRSHVTIAAWIKNDGWTFGQGPWDQREIAEILAWREHAGVISRPRAQKIRVCIWCAGQFRSRNKRRFCRTESCDLSRSWHRKNNRKKQINRMVCSGCQAIFFGRKRKFCSAECRKEQQQKTERLPGISLSHAGQIAGVKLCVITRWCRYFGLPSFRLESGRQRIDPATLSEWLATKRPAPKEKRPDYRSNPSSDHRGGVIYALIDPRPEKWGKIRYIGKSENFSRRRKDYLRDFNRNRAHSPPLRAWFRKLKQLGLRPKFKVIEECLFGLNALECQWIERGRKKKWPLLNCSGGGVGGTWNEESRRRLSQLISDKWKDPEYVRHWEEATAKRCGFATADEWKADRLRREQQREANRQQHARNMDIAAERVEARRVRQLPVVPLTWNGAAFIPLTQGKWAIVDAEDWGRVGRLKWQACLHQGKWRAWRNGSQKHGVEKSKILLVRAIDPVKRRRTYANGDLLDCRKANIS